MLSSVSIQPEIRKGIERKINIMLQLNELSHDISRIGFSSLQLNSKIHFTQPSLL